MAEILRVLYVDDEPDLLDIGKLFLERSGDFSVATACSASAALELLKKEQFDAIVSDYQMPGIDGIQFLVEVRSRFGPVPFILFTGRGREDVVIQAINSGADFYLQKGGETSAQFAELTHKIKQAALRNRAEDSLAESERVHATMISNLPGFVYRCANDPDWTMEYISDGCREITGYSPDELLNNKSRTYNDLVHPEFQKSLWDTVQNFLEKKEVIEVEYPLITKTGETRWVWERGRGIYSDDRRLLYIEGFITDITERRQAEEAIRTAENSYRNIFLNSQIGLFRTDVRTGMLLDVNDTVARFIGFQDRDSLLAEPFNIVERYVDPFDHEKIISLLQADGEFQNYEARFRKNDGSIMWMRFSGRLVKEKGWLEGVSEDITGRKEAEQALAESESFSRNLVENLPDYIGISDHEGKILYMNAPAAYALGYTVAEIIGTSVHSHVAEECRGDVISGMTARHDGGEVPPYEIDVISKDGRRISVIVKGSPILYRNSPALLLVLTDITGRKRVEEALAESEEKYRTVADFTYDWEYWIAPDGNYIYVSPSCERITGYTSEEFMHDSNLLITIAHADDRDCIIDHVSHKEKNVGEKDSIEFRIISRTGEERWIGLKSQSVYDRNGKYLGNRGSNRDITGRKLAEEEIKKSGASLRAIFDYSIMSFLLIDRHHTIQYFNRVANERSKELFGKELHLGDSIYEFILPPERESFDQNFQCALNGKLARSEKTFIAGTVEHCYEFHYSPVRDDQQVIGVFFSTLDITERKQAEEALRESERKVKDIINFLPDATFVINKDGRVIAWNRAIELMTGVFKEDIIGKGDCAYAVPFYGENIPILIDSLISVEDEIDSRYKNIRNDGGTVTAEVFVPSMRNGDGAYVWATASRLNNRNGEIIGAIESIRDVTDKQDAEDALMESEAKYRSLVEHSLEGVLILDLQGTILFANSAAARTIEADDYAGLPGRNVMEFIAPESRNDVVGDFIQVSRGHDAYLAHYNAISAKGNKLYVECVGKIISYEGKPADLISIRDITERKLAEEALHQANRKLNLLSGITRHDINNQLTVLQGYLAILEDSQLDPSQKKYFQKVTTAAKRISAMIQFSKGYEEIGIHAPIWQDCRSLVDMAAKQAPLGRVMLKNDIPAGAEVLADPLVVKVFYNLMDNAVRYGGKITTIRFSVDEHDDDHIVMCEDEGDGVAADEKEKIFERGFGKNTGLGLALSREILDITGIAISETGEPGKGARFEMVVPKGAWRMGAEDHPSKK